MIANDTIVILQARMASERLPGKALAPLAGRTLLRRCLDRLSAADVGPVMLATTRGHEDDVLVNEAARAGVPAFRGSSENVLWRFIAAAQWVNARYVVRATADNPAIDIDSPGRVLRAVLAGADHAVDEGLPVGATVEAVSVVALCRALESTVDPFDLEHVTTFIRREGRQFNTVKTPVPASIRRPDLRLTIDTASDLRFMAEVLERFRRSAPEPTLAAIIHAADAVASQAVAS
jgi:spore coat polysaccharide biosynthesis protein SpsF